MSRTVPHRSALPPSLRLRLVAAIGLTLIADGSARADVLEIGAQGAVTVYSAPAVFTADGATPIVPKHARRSPTPREDSSISVAIAEASLRYAVPPDLMRAVAWRESRFHQNAVSAKGAIGVMQLMAGTARQLGVDPYDLRQNIHGGAAYLSQMLTRYHGDTGLALTAYNAGPGTVDRYGAAPPFRETRQYVADIMALISMGAGPASTLALGR